MRPEPTGFLYPFIDANERDASDLVADLAASARAKMTASSELRMATAERWASVVERTAQAMADRFRGGGRLLAFGNGGSATDADGTVELFKHPPLGRRALPAMSLVDNPAILTALANDIDFDVVFSRQIIAYARSADIAVGFSTSGDSVNVIRALQEGSTRGLLTIGMCGYHGGAMATSDAVDCCLVVQSDSVHRIQEAQDGLLLQLWSAVQGHLERKAERL
jgi:D-sedoheptulose 7-phosphate isomerase